MSCIYMIKNIINGKIYIGSAVNFIRRKNLHISELRHNRHHSIKLQNSWNKHGEDNFEFIVIEECDKEFLLEKEQFYLDSMLPFGNSGYNISKTATQPNYGRKNREEINRKISIALTGLKRTDATRKRLSEISKQRVGSKNGMYGRKLSDKHRLLLSNAKSEPIIQYDKFTGDFIKVWDSAKFAGKEIGVSDSSIIKCSKKKVNTAGGYIWRKYDSSHIEGVNLFDIEPKIVLDVRYKDVYQYDTGMNLIRTWISIGQIHNETGLYEHKIRRCCIENSKKECGPYCYCNEYIWSYNKLKQC